MFAKVQGLLQLGLMPLAFAHVSLSCSQFENHYLTQRILRPSSTAPRRAMPRNKPRLRELIASYTVEEEKGNWFYLRPGTAGRVLLDFIEERDGNAPGTLRIHLYPGCDASSRLLRQFGIDGKDTVFQRHGVKYIVTGLGSPAPLLTVWRTRHIVDLLLTGLFHPHGNSLLRPVPTEVFRNYMWPYIRDILGIRKPKIANYVPPRLPEGVDSASDSDFGEDDLSDESDTSG